MTALPGDLAGAGFVPWALGHPGRAALLSAVAACAGVVVVIVGLAERDTLGQSGMLGQLWLLTLLLAGAGTFLVALPVSLGLAGAACVTQRELWSGVVGGFVAVLVTCTLVGVVLPVQGVV
jgi:hypothetical protein